jgi:hypothetical protein
MAAQMHRALHKSQCDGIGIAMQLQYVVDESEACGLRWDTARENRNFRGNGIWVNIIRIFCEY